MLRTGRERTSSQIADAWNEEILVELLHLARSAVLSDPRVMVGQVLGLWLLHSRGHCDGTGTIAPAVVLEMGEIRHGELEECLVVPLYQMRTQSAE